MTKPTVKTITRKYAIELQCHECLGYYQDGKVDCENTNCKLYPFMPYRQKEANTESNINPRKKGLVTWDQSQRDITDEQRERLKKQLSNGRNKLTASTKPDKDNGTTKQDSDFLDLD